MKPATPAVAEAQARVRNAMRARFAAARPALFQPTQPLDHAQQRVLEAIAKRDAERRAERQAARRARRSRRALRQTVRELAPYAVVLLVIILLIIGRRLLVAVS